MTEELTEELNEETKEPVVALTEAQIHALYTRGLIKHATWVDALRGSRSARWLVDGQHALRTCTFAIEELVARAIEAARTVDAADAITAARGVIQQKIGVTAGDLAETALLDEVSAIALTHYVRALLEVLSRGAHPQHPQEVVP